MFHYCHWMPSQQRYCFVEYFLWMNCCIDRIMRYSTELDPDRERHTYLFVIRRLCFVKHLWRLVLRWGTQSNKTRMQNSHIPSSISSMYNGSSSGVSFSWQADHALEKVVRWLIVILKINPPTIFFQRFVPLLSIDDCRVALIGIEPRGHLRLPLFPQLLFALFLLWFDISWGQ